MSCVSQWWLNFQFEPTMRLTSRLIRQQQQKNHFSKLMKLIRKASEWRIDNQSHITTKSEAVAITDAVQTGTVIEVRS